MTYEAGLEMLLGNGTPDSIVGANTAVVRSLRRRKPARWEANGVACFVQQHVLLLKAIPATADGNENKTRH